MNFSLPGFGKKSVLGLDIGSGSVKAVEIDIKGKEKGFELLGLGVAPMPHEAIVQGAFLNSSAIVGAIQEAVDTSGIKTRDAVVAVSGHSVIVKKVSLSRMSSEELESQIQWEAEQYIPFDVNEVNLEFQILDTSDDPDTMDVLLVAAKKDLIDDYVQVMVEAGLNPVAVDVASFALANAFEINQAPDPQGVVALVNIGAHVANINVLQNGVPAFTRDITTGGNQYTQEIQKALSVGFEEAERVKLGDGSADQNQAMVPQEVENAMRAVTDTVVGEISRSLDFFAATTESGRIERVMLSGGGSRVVGLSRAFQERSGFEVEMLNPLSRALPGKTYEASFLQETAPSLAVGIGLAARRSGF
ncbi:MAG TPA: type IV pilus assembly protein PilM [Myxococcales bacterium]|jgi:type IV pilus assembly protein PilM|nr:type IV pilus assembly protein PilM [Myxococcales bacterium]HIL80078.1 type IV pilus assembly protein PilM [Myxococcales bacterium]